MSITPAYCLCTVTTKYFERTFASPQDQRFILKSCVSQFESLIKTIFVSSKVQILQALFHLLNLLYFSRFCYFMDSSNPSQCIFSSTKSFYTGYSWLQNAHAKGPLISREACIWEMCAQTMKKNMHCLCLEVYCEIAVSPFASQPAGWRCWSRRWGRGSISKHLQLRMDCHIPA